MHFISGGAGSLRQGEASPAAFVARSFDTDYHFMLVEITRDGLYFQAISRVGETVDAGVLRRPARDLDRDRIDPTTITSGSTAARP